MSMARPKLTFYYDIVCPYAYLGSTGVRQLAADANAELVYKPMLLGGVMNALEQPGSRPPMPEARVRGNAEDLQRWAAQRGVKLVFPTGHPRRTVDAMRLLCAAELHVPEQLAPLTHALYDAYWVRGLDVTDRAVLGELAAAHKIDVAFLDSDLVKAKLRKNTDDALAEGIFGAPSFVIDGPLGHRMIFGQDRMNFVLQALRGHMGDRFTEQFFELPETPPEPGRDIAFLFDYSSPFTYLASTQIERVAREGNGRLEWRPILLGGLFKEIGNPIVPFNSMNAAKRTYTARDMHDWAAHWGVPFKFPSRFPMNTVTALRMTLAAGERGQADLVKLAHALFRAYWVDDRDIADTSVLAQIAKSAGFDGEALLERTKEPALKQRLIDNTTSAVKAGAFGLPTFLVDGEVFFGQDRLDFVARALSARRK